MSERTASLQQLFDWLVDGAPNAPTPMAVVEHLGTELRASGVPVDRIGAFVRTLHPHIVGRGFFWTPGAPTRVVENAWAGLNTEGFKRSVPAKVEQTGQEVRARLDAGQPGYTGLDELGAQGFTDYLMLPLKFMGGTVHSIGFGTKAPGGFTDAHLDALRFVTRPLARVSETLALMRTAVNLLNTYVGRDAGERILAGRIQRGDTEAIRAVIWFSDLRGFTSMSGERTPAQIIAVLNQVFDCQVPHIEQHGGEVLKFMGDGMLAIFPIVAENVADAAARAAAAGAAAFASLDALNLTRPTEAPLRFGVALHVGEVAYGNIGGASRLDFTAIGPAVNLASRIEGLTGKLDKRLLLSEAVAKTATFGTRLVGRFELKGVTGECPVYETT
jgi:adenylate cyclase